MTSSSSPRRAVRSPRSDLREMAERAAHRGLRVAYEALAWGTLPEAELAGLRACQLLYHRDEGGSFVHAYTESLAGGLFFEIVERRGYRGFGAVNAAFRIAAQAPTAEELAGRLRVALL